LSAGYELDLDPTPGEYQGRRYDAVQRNIRINHVAAVPLGRAGTAMVLDDGWGTDWADSWNLEHARELADIAPNRTRTVVDMGRWCRHDATDLLLPLNEEPNQDANMKKITLKIDGKDVVIEHADNATPEQIAALVSKAHADAATAREAARKVEQDAATAKAVSEALAKAKADAMAPPFGKKPEDEEADKKAKADAAAADAARELRFDTLATARAVLGLSFKADGLDTAGIQLAVIERVQGADARKRLEKRDASVVAYEYENALAKFEADSKQDYGGTLLLEIQRSKANDAGKSQERPAGPITEGRRDAEDQAALPRHQRTKAVG
jgi:hypothetical protein